MTELTKKEMIETAGGVLPFILGYAIGVGLGACGAIAGAELVKAYKE